MASSKTKQSLLDSYFLGLNNGQTTYKPSYADSYSLENSLKAAKILRLRHDTPILRGTSSTSKHRNIWPDTKVVPELARDDSKNAFFKAGLRLVQGVYHQRWYILEFSGHWYFAQFSVEAGLQLQPNLHTSINLYTQMVWNEQIMPLPAMGCSFGIGTVCLRYKKELYVYCNATCSVTATVDIAFKICNETEKPEFDVFHPGLLQYTKLPSHLWHLIKCNFQEFNKSQQDPITLAFNPWLKYNAGDNVLGCDVCCHLMATTVCDQAARKKQCAIYLYFGKDCGIWTLYHMPPDVQKWLGWRVASDFKKESKLLEVTDALTNKWVMGPLDFCIPLVQKLGNRQLLQDMKYQLMGRIQNIVNQAKKDGTWQPGH
ncbi:hypothetical protein EV421DRAFT_1729452 [Armillaria borealis]|uniref:Uncharacterized protein n=1 Tax=Armillaria borealis TaxID=47425 RepID=A0AA39KDS1_9AGAR|nr:hypothetical protein EV421DRAFT_1729452 [Armillaria borealis]